MAELSPLQEKALSLGIKKVWAVSKKDLEAQIAQAEANAKASSESAAPKNEANTAVVVDKGGQEIRRYSLDVHGENFKELAKGFIEKVAEKKDYAVQYKKVKPGVSCPSCGYIIHPDGE